MAKTLNDVITLTRVYLDESQPAEWSSTQVLQAINVRYQYIVSKVIEIYQEFYLTKIPKAYDMLDGIQQYTIDPNFLKLERVEINYGVGGSDSQPIRAVAIKMDEIPTNLDNSLLNGSALNYAGYYLIGDQATQQVGFIPVPSQDGTDAIKVWGIIAPDDLVDTTDSVLIPYPDLFYSIVAKLAAADLLKKGQQAVTYADDLINEGMSDVLNMQTFISERQSDGPNMIEDAVFADVDVGNYVW